ncbi:MAG: triose-phosphate isomerase [Dehalococcoidia bacterium]|nr:triose-phosphate isomerase [Dehalococcoidia bacterium]
MRRPFVAGNWKMNTNREEAVSLASEIAAAPFSADVDVAVCVPFPHLGPVADALRHSRVRLGAQDLYWEASGAFTGEVSAAMIASYGSLVIIGHSERRHIFGETDEDVCRKVRATLDSPLDPIVCVGETLDERNANRTEAVLERQLREGFKDIELGPRVTITYEPVWAIGTGETATPDIAQEACAFVRARLRDIAGDTADAIRIQYGGSVNPSNAADLMARPDIDGALVGGASLKADQFIEIVKAASP